MKFKKTLKYVVPAVGVAALAVTLPLALTSCKSDDGQSININGTVLTSNSIEWTYSRDQTYWVNAKSPELPILNGNIYVGKDNSILNTKGVQVTYQWYKNAVPIQNEADANSSQYVVKTLEKYPSNYFCVARISYQGKQIVSTSPLFIVEPSPLSASIEYLNPTRKPKFLSSVDGFNSQLKAVATSTSTNFDLPSEIKKGNVQFQWMKKAILFGQDKIVGQQEVFSPSEPGIYYCNITVIKDGQAVTVKTKDEVVLPNTLVSSIKSDNNSQTENTKTSGNTFYLKQTGETTLTASLDSYMGQTPSAPSAPSAPSSRNKRSTLSGVYATMWLKKVDDAGGYASNEMLGNYEIVAPMSSDDHSVKLGKNETGDYLLVEAIYPQGTQPSDLTNYSNITGIKYTDVKVEPTRNINLDKLDPAAIAKVRDTINEQTQVSNFLNQTSTGYKNLVSTILKELGLIGKANVEFTVNNGNESAIEKQTSDSDDNNQTSNTNVTVTVTLKPANGYNFENKTLGTWTTNIQKYQVLNNFASLVNSTNGTKKDNIVTQLKSNLNQSNYNTWLTNVKEDGTTYNQIMNIITGKSEEVVTSKQDVNIPSNSFKMKINFINNGSAASKKTTTTSSDSDGNSSVKIVYTANPGFVFDNKGNTQLEYTYSNIANGFAIDPTNTTITSLLPKIGGLLDLGGIIEKLFPQITPYLGIINKVLQDPYIWGSNLGAEIVKLISGLGGKTTIEGDPVVAASGKYKTFTYTFKTNNPNKWKFPSTAASKKDLSSDTTTITLQTKIPKDKELPLNYTNGWISIPTISSSNETKPSSKEGSTTLTVNATIAAPSFLSSFLKLNFEWYQQTPATETDGKQTQEWTYISDQNGSNTLTISSPKAGTKYKCKIWLTVNGLPKLWIGHAVWSPEYTVPTDSSSSGSGSGTGSTSGGAEGSSSSSGSTESHNQFFTTTNKFFKF